MSLLINKINHLFFILIFLSIFFIQSGASFFNGLPWLNSVEVIVTSLFIPIILIFKRKLFKNFNIKVLIIFFFQLN